MTQAARKTTPRRPTKIVNPSAINLSGTGSFHSDYTRGQIIGLQLLDRIAHHAVVHQAAPVEFASLLLKAAARSCNSANVMEGVLVSFIRALSQTVTFQTVAYLRRQDAESERYYSEAVERDRALRAAEKGGAR